VAIPLATVVPRVRIPDARDELELNADERIALYFGAVYAAKDPDPVWEAFETLRDWRLIAAGPYVEKSYRRWALARRGAPERPPVMFDGFVDEHTKELVYSAADLAVISFRRGRMDDSATVTDAIAWGIPMVCSDGGAAADTVRKYGLGSLFTAGDAESLAHAVRCSGALPDSNGLEEARGDLSLRRMARTCLTVLGTAAGDGSAARRET
jgi:glycosyltransferase involved in cell wall biosynthesis